MTMFFDNLVKMEENEHCLLSAWSNSEVNVMLAVATNTPRIIFMSDEGTIVPNFEITRGKNKITQMKWHPVIHALAIGWSDGCLTLWQEDDRLIRDEKSVHHDPITELTFSSDGSRLVSGDVNGTVGVWRTHRGMTPVCQYSRPGAITQIVFCSLLINQDPNVDNVNSLFFFGGQSGSVCLADDLKNCSEVCKVPGAVKNILFYEKENSVIVITSHLLLVQFKLNLAEKLVPDRKVKLAVAGDPKLLDTIWVGQGLMATVSGESIIRLFNIEADENYHLSVNESAFQGQLFNDKINTISYNPKKRILSGGTKNGFIIMWKCKIMSAMSPISDEGWQALPPVQAAQQPINNLAWGGNNNILSAVQQNGVMILNHQLLKKKMKDNFKMIQISNKAVEVRVRNDASANSDYQIIMTLGMNIKGIDCCGSHTLFWNGKFAQLYDVKGTQGPQLLGNFESNSIVCALTPDSVVQCAENKLEVCSYSGEVKQVLPFTEQEGEVIKIDARGKFMAVVTSKSLIKIFDISRRQYKQLGVTRKFEIKNGEPIGQIKEIALNSDGKKLAILSDQTPFPSITIPDTKIYIYDIDMDKFMHFECSQDRIPIEAFWDQQDARLLAVETEYAKMSNGETKGAGEESKSGEALNAIKDSEIEEDFRKTKTDDASNQVKSLETFFVTTDYGIKRQDTIKFEDGEETLLGVQVPYFYYMGRKPSEEDEDDMDQPQTEQKNSMIILRKPMKDFVGLENVEQSIKTAIMNFSHFLTVGNMDEAYNSVRNIHNNTVWQNMAQMCVKTKRLDVAMVCLGNMRFARGAKSTRETENEREIEARLAMVAIQLNMIDDAKELYKECGRYDLLVKLHMSCGEWDEAIEVAQKFNRINLKNTHFQMAKHFEAVNEVDRAIKHYIESGTHKTEVPRMLTKLNMIDRLQSFIQSLKDPALYKWWAQYLESQDLVQDALNFYREAQDFGSCVRLFCSVGDIQNAARIANNSNDPQACFNMARHYENENNIGEAIVFYSRSSRLHHAIRLAKESGMDQQVMMMSLQSSKPIQIQSAQYFEQKGKIDKAVQLYSKGGNKRRAMDLAMQHNLAHMIDDISAGVGDGDDPEVLKQSVDFLLNNGQNDKAVEIMISLGQLDEALVTAERNNVALKEEWAQKLIPPAATDPMKKRERTEILLRIAKLVKKQGNFKFAAKVYTLANEKIKGLKCLLKSSDMRAVISFAQTARSTEVWVMAGNFLRNQNWHNDPDIMKTIIQFYSKAKSFESLSNFYNECAQVEIDEFGAYEKALEAMIEAKRQLDKSDATNKQQKQNMLLTKIRYLEQFCEARQFLNQGNSDAMSQIVVTLVDAPGAEDAVQMGDVYSMLIKHFCQKSDPQQAYQYYEKMQRKKIQALKYLDAKLVEDMHRALGMPPPDQSGRKGGAAAMNDDMIEEDIPEDF